MRPIVDDDLEKVLHTLDEKEFASVFRDKFVNAFAELKQKLDTSHEIAAVKNIRLESDTRSFPGAWMRSQNSRGGTIVQNQNCLYLGTLHQ